MKFERRNDYGTIRYHPRDDDARLLVSIFKHPPARSLSHNQISVLSRLGLEFELVGNESAMGRFKDFEVHGV